LTRVLTSDGTTDGAIAQSGLTYDGNTLKVSGDTTIYGNQYIHSAEPNPISTTTGTTVQIIPVSSGMSVNFNYVVKESGGAMRAGTVIAVWNSSTAGYTDFSTTDIVASTLPISFIVDVFGTDVRLRAVITSGTWTIKVGTEIIF
jgi:hypothetical protein